MAFELNELPALSRSRIDRGDLVRKDPERLRSGWSTARVLELDGRGRYPVDGNGRLRWRPSHELGDEPPTTAVFLGIAGVDLWAHRVDEVAEPFSDARSGAQLLDAEEAAVLATALGILNWHVAARYSPVDGSVTEVGQAGWVRRNPDGREEYPRTDPAVIVLVHDGGDQALLGRQSVWPERWFSTLAGFVEPGESLEHCVAREISEEAGVTVREPRYLGSQPWPFPRSIMLGFEAIADPDEPISLNDGELDDARWFHRDEIRAALAGDWASDAGDAPLLLPPSVSIARTLISSWANA